MCLCSHRLRVRNVALQQHFALFIKYGYQWLAALAFLIIYIIVMKTLPVPTFTYNNPTYGNVTVECNGTTGDLSPACNAARQVDLWVLGWDHMYKAPEYMRLPACQYYPVFNDCPKPVGQAPPWCFVPQDPEGILSSLPGVLTTFIGFHFGNVLIQYEVWHHDMHYVHSYVSNYDRVTGTGWRSGWQRRL